MNSLICLQLLLGNPYFISVVLQSILIVAEFLVLVVAGVVVAPVPTRTTLGAVWSKLGN